MHVREATPAEKQVLTPQLDDRSFLVVAEEGDTIAGYAACSTAYDGSLFYAHDMYTGDNPVAFVALWQRIRKIGQDLGYKFVTFDVEPGGALEKIGRAIKIAVLDSGDSRYQIRSLGVG